MRNVADNLPARREQLAQSAAETQPATRERHTVSTRATRLWDRLGDWYGTRFADQYGDEPSRDWCGIVDNTTNDELVRVLQAIRQRHVTFPPTLPEFAALVKEVRDARAALKEQEQDNAYLLTRFVVSRRSLTQQQMLPGAWSFLYRTSADGGMTCTGVVIAKCDAPSGFRVMVEDMNAEQVDL